MSSACIYYTPEAYETTGSRLMGRNAAGESFLRGHFLYSKSERFFAQVSSKEHAVDFEHKLRSYGREESLACIDVSGLKGLSEAGNLYYPGPNIGQQAFYRAAFGAASWGLCGITHTTSSSRAMDGLADLLTAPVQTWDAVICTSSSVKDNVQRLLQSQADYLQERLGITRLVLPMLPIIPLGIHTSDFEFSRDKRAAARRQLDIEAEEIVVLFMGRLSFHAKANPLAMYQALQAAVECTGKRVTLLECGWFANDSIEHAFIEAAKLTCADVRVLRLDGRNRTTRESAWASADVFCSLADNIQETFGITPVEAMAAGLPVVVSDWDGYKDSVRSGVDGFRIPTLMPQAGLAGDLALCHALGVDTYDQYCGNASSLVAVDVASARDAFVALLKSPQLRSQMGASGKLRAKQLFDWQIIIKEYEALWAQQNALRLVASKEQRVPPNAWPARMDPLYAFESYSTNFIRQDTVLCTNGSAKDCLSRLEKLLTLEMVSFAKRIQMSKEEIEVVIQRAESGACAAHELCEGVQVSRRPYVFRALAWLIKLNILKVSV